MSLLLSTIERWIDLGRRWRSPVPPLSLDCREKNHSRYFSNVFTNLHQSSPFFETSSSTRSNQNSVHRTNSTTVAMASRSARRLLPLALLALYGPAQVPQPLAPRQPKVGEVLLGPRRLQDGMETWRWETLGVGS